MQLLLRHGANARFIFPVPNLQTPTPLDYAIFAGHLEIIHTLIDAGADLNIGSPIIGLPLHIILGENHEDASSADHLCRMLETLLQAGADPNCIMKSSISAFPKPALGVYLNMCPPRVEERIIRMLLKYDAKVVFQSKVYNEWGILKALHHLSLARDRRILELLLSAVESYDLSQIERCSLLPEKEKNFLLRRLNCPASLMHQCRLSIRKHITNDIKHRQMSQQPPEMSSSTRAEKCKLFRELVHSVYFTTDDWDQIAAIIADFSILPPDFTKTKSQSSRGQELLERISQLPLPDMYVRYLRYEEEFPINYRYDFTTGIGTWDRFEDD